MKLLFTLLHFGLTDSIELEHLFYFLIASFLVITFILFGIIMLYRTIKIIDEHYIDSVRDAYDEVFMAVAFSEDDELTNNIEKVKELNKQHLHKKRHAHVIINELLLLYHSFSGTSKTNLRELYMRSGFVDYSEKKVKSHHWELKAQGLREVADMKDERIISTLKKINKEKNKLLLSNVQLSLLKINGFKGLDFLNDVDTPISDWQQINLIEALKEHHTASLPDFTVWLNNKEITVKLFVVRLMHYFKQIESSEKLIGLLQLNDLKLKREVIKTLAALNRTEALPFLITCYEKEQPEIKIAVIHAYAILAERNKTDVLLHWLMQTNDPEIQHACLQAFETMGVLEELDLENNNTLKKITDQFIKNKNR